LSSFFFALARYMAGDNEVTRSMYSKWYLKTIK
jgi:hypothetical protein